MAVQKNLVGWTVSVVPAPSVMSGHPGNGTVETEPQWALVFQEKGSGDLIQFVFGREVKEELLRQLAGGIVLGGEMPKL